MRNNKSSLPAVTVDNLNKSCMHFALISTECPLQCFNPSTITSCRCNKIGASVCTIDWLLLTAKALPHKVS